MFIPFDQLPTYAKTWIYQADRKLSPAETEILNRELRSFTEQWEVHGSPLESSFEIRMNQFVVLAANDKVSGCSIDSSVRIMKELGRKVNVDFFNRNLVAFKKDESIITIPLTELKSGFTNGLWSADTRMFNNAVSTKEELGTKWITPAGSTWLKRYIAPQGITQ